MDITQFLGGVIEELVAGAILAAILWAVHRTLYGNEPAHTFPLPALLLVAAVGGALAYGLITSSLERSESGRNVGSGSSEAGIPIYKAGSEVRLGRQHISEDNQLVFRIAGRVLLLNTVPGYCPRIEWNGPQSDVDIKRTDVTQSDDLDKTYITPQTGGAKKVYVWLKPIRFCKS